MVQPRPFLRRKFLLHLGCLPCFCMSMVASANSSSQQLATFAVSMEAPSGFASLTETRQVLADLYFGGMKIGEAPLTVRPGYVSFDHPDKVLSLLKGVRDPHRLRARLAQELPSNPALICSPMKSDECGRLSPETAGVIFDEDRFRVDLFVSPDLIEPVSPVEANYLKAPSAAASLVSSMGLTLSGSHGNASSYNVQNRTLVGVGSGRLRSDSSFSRELGLVVDNFVAEIDRRTLRYSAGMFWAPGLDLIGQRRILGAGFATQFDTRTDKDLLEGTPLYLFLDRAARVDVLVDGRLLDSRAYEAGNNLIDTTSLPTGAYSLVLRVQEPGGRTREERRFFARNAQVAPMGKPIYFGFAGLLANTRRNRPISASDTLYYQLGTARRVSPKIAVDAALVGTQHRSLAEIGTFYLGRTLRLRAAALLSSRGDRGGLLQAGSSGSGPLSLNFDLRRIHSKNGSPLIPVPFHAEGFDPSVSTAARFGGGSYTQISGSIGYRIDQGYVGLSGGYRRDRSRRANYSVGPSMTFPVIQRSGVQLTAQADAQYSRSGLAAYAGFRLMTLSRGRSLTGTAGYASLRRDGEPRGSRMVGSLAGEIYHQGDDRTELNGTAAVERTIDDINVRAGGALYSRFGIARGDVLQRFGKRSGTQYGLNLQAGLALSPESAALGGRELQQSALIATVAGDAADTTFDVLVNEVPKGRIRSGQRLPIYLPAYRAYQVRLRPVHAASVSFDTQAREVTLFPGTVATMRWGVDMTFTVFGQALDAKGLPITAARVESRHGTGETDANGFFQIDVAKGDLVIFNRSADDTCRVTLSNVEPKAGYAALGKVVCR